MVDEMIGLDHVNDFYYLLAIQHEAKKHADEFSKKWDRLYEKSTQLLDQLVPNLTGAIFSYLFYASMGEARHAQHHARTKWTMVFEEKMSRDSVYALAHKYDPKTNLSKLRELYDDEWVSGYGGKKWADIVRATLLYYDVPAVAWIDHIIDLEHNCGTVFSKGGAGLRVGLDLDYSNSLEGFLSFKASCDILEESYNGYEDDDGNEYDGTLRLSPSVISLLESFNLTDFTPNHCTWDWSPIEWGDEVISIRTKYQDWATSIPTVQSIAQDVQTPPILLSLYAKYGDHSEKVDYVEELVDAHIEKSKMIIKEWLNWYTKDDNHEALLEYINTQKKHILEFIPEEVMKPTIPWAGSLFKAVVSE